jgi:hypothetical protein
MEHGHQPFPRLWGSIPGRKIQLGPMVPRNIHTKLLLRYLLATLLGMVLTRLEECSDAIEWNERIKET